MKQINHNAAMLLLRKMQDNIGAAHSHSWRCIRLNFSGGDKQHNPALHQNFVVAPVMNLLQFEDGYVYACEDGDVFIIFQGLAKPIIHRLSSHFEGIDYNQFGDLQSNGFSTVFDLSRYWDDFFELCATKAPQRPQRQTAHAFA